jgi:hypothetical protein
VHWSSRQPNRLTFSTIWTPVMMHSTLFNVSGRNRDSIQPGESAFSLTINSCKFHRLARISRVYLTSALAVNTVLRTLRIVPFVTNELCWSGCAQRRDQSRPDPKRLCFMWIGSGQPVRRKFFMEPDRADSLWSILLTHCLELEFVLLVLSRCASFICAPAF